MADVYGRLCRTAAPRLLLVPTPHFSRAIVLQERKRSTISQHQVIASSSKLGTIHNYHAHPAAMASSKPEEYNLIYWPSVPGRGEHIRLALEEAGAKYTDTAHTEGGMDQVYAYATGSVPDDGINTPPFAPPILKHGDLMISQTSNILLYLGTRLGLVPDASKDPDGLYRVNALVLTALDGLSDEPHDCHHPIATGLYYEDQKPESKRRAEDYVKNRLPKFLGYFERVLGSKAAGDGPWLYGGSLTNADLVLFQVCICCVLIRGIETCLENELIMLPVR
jgi:glutathione S-transferase